VPQLKQELKLRKLKVSGKKEELITRLLTSQSEGVIPAAADDEPYTPPPPKQPATAASQQKRKADSKEPLQKVDPKKKKTRTETRN